MGKKRSEEDFFREFFKNPRELGTPFESSRYLARFVAKQIRGEKIVELGAGNGPVTRSILHYNPWVNLTSFEINPCLLRNLREIKSKRLTIIEDSAENFRRYVRDFDCVVSGLPLTSMEGEIVNSILESSRSARYIQYKYFPEKRLLKRYFESVRGTLVLRNIPPALIYICEN